jgi:iron complex outermembrane recepter protein
MQHISNVRRVSLLSATLSMTALAGRPGFAATAETADNGNLDEIVVIAEKRVERLQDVPVSMSVADAQQLADQHVYDITDLANLTPALEVRQTGGTPGGGAQIRGIGTQAFTRSAEPAVGLVVDGVAQGVLNTNTIFDVQRIEVLRGPQGTLFGLSSSAGVIQLVTNAPDPSKFSGYVHTDLSREGSLGSEFGQQTVHAVVNMPLTSESALRVAVSGNMIQGVQYDAFNNHPSQSDHYGIRARYLWAHDDFTLNLIADFDSQWEDAGTENAVISGFTYVTADPQLTSELAACGITPGFDNKSRCENHLGVERQKNYGFSAQMDWNLGGNTLTSISSYRGNKVGPDTQDVQAVPTEIPQLYQFPGIILEARQFNEELRLTSSGSQALQYVAGLYYNDYVGTTSNPPDADFHIVFPGFVFGAPVPTLDISLPATNYPTRTTNRAEAAFGQMTYHVTDQLGLIAGARFTHQSVTDFTSQDLNQAYGVPEVGFFGPGAPNVSYNLATDVNNFSGKLGVDYQFSHNLNSYATVTKGYKGPQAESASSTTPAVLVPAEIPTSYELGVKGTIAGSFGVDANVFYTKDHNYQTQIQGLNSSGLLVSIPDSADITSKGAEIDFYGKPVQGLSINGGLIYDVAELPSNFRGFNPNYLNFIATNPVAGTLPMGGYQIPYVPKFKVTTQTDYSWMMGNVMPDIGGDVVYKTSIRESTSPDPRFVYSGPPILGLHAGLFAPDKRWGVTLFGRNLLENREPALLFGGPAVVTPGADPTHPNGYIKGVSGWITKNSEREVGISFDFKF